MQLEVLLYLVTTTHLCLAHLAMCMCRSKSCCTAVVLQVLQCLHSAMQAVRLHDPELRVSIGLRLALHLEASQNKSYACQVIREVSNCRPCTSAACNCTAGQLSCGLPDTAELYASLQETCHDWCMTVLILRSRQVMIVVLCICCHQWQTASPSVCR